MKTRPLSYGTMRVPVRSVLFAILFATMLCVSSTLSVTALCDEAVRESNTSTPQEGNLFAEVSGSYVSADKDAILARISQIRQEAYSLGYVSSYVEPQWSQGLEKIALLRAAETNVYWSHTRPNGSICFTVTYDSVSSSVECLAKSSVSAESAILHAIELWYSEKSEYEKYLSGSSSYGEYGHYEALIDPYPYVGLGSFTQDASGGSYKTTAMEASFRTDSTDKLADIGAVTQLVEVAGSYVSGLRLSIDKTLAVGESVTLNATATFSGLSISQAKVNLGLNWSSSNTNAATVVNGTVSGKNIGVTSITASIGDFSVPLEVVVLPRALSGNTRYETMQDIVGDGFSSSEYAVLATGDNFPDALAASSLAGALDAPIVLVGSDNTASAIATLQKLGVEKLYVVGGTASLTDEALAEIVAATGASATRIAGATRQQTATEIADATQGLVSSGVAIIATGKNFADALAASPYAYKLGLPIYLTEDSGILSSETLAAIQKHSYECFVIVGGTSVVNEAVKDQLQPAEQSGGIEKNVIFFRAAGETRYETSVEIVKLMSETFNAYTAFENIAIATGDNFPDALAGGAYCGHAGKILLLASETSEATFNLLSEHASEVQSVVCLGGTGALSNATRVRVVKALTGAQ